ncbi:bifunctional serine/threonine-protein kinase/formylglycine-generating enzyme family protein [Archangium sp.]|uniref:bifunctional serine/threonine-protein kinase/formylglycine-generating enzyme family protein n=1 Tax=Archangium sp. TaxID=1872627 RepID=UPI002E3710C5|nr:protein kinase [Archangium sp.]
MDSQCLTDELLAGLLEGRLSGEELSRAHHHTAECPSCRELLVTLVRGARSPSNAVNLSHSETPHGPLATDWSPPTEFDEFQLERPLGRGAMGVIYLAHDRELDRRVAVKFIAAARPHSRLREHFQTEARAIARLQHPNVVTVFRVGEVEGHPYIVSEYLAGQSVEELTAPLPWRRVLGLGIGLARGLAAAHRQGVLHRDLKPANIFLTLEGEVKLLDFGLAELVEEEGAGRPGSMRRPVGTPRYMAPELFRGAPATPRSDIYSLGLVLHELCTGPLPQRPCLEPPGHGGGPRLTPSVPGIDPDFAALLERCLRVEPEERFASAEALRDALERLREPEVLTQGNPYRGLAPFEAEHRALFFGRDADIRAVLERLRRHPLVLVAGDSGVGKSSLCRAGILPRVARGALDEYRDFTALTLEPGRRPLAALAAALAPVLGQPEAELHARLSGAPGELGPALRAAHQEGRGLLLFVDQLEELVTLSEPAQAERFASLLGELALPSAGVRVLLAARGDFLLRLAALPGLGGEVERALYLLRPLTPQGVREAIVGPARGRGVVFESEALLQTLVEAAARSAGSLPLLQFTLAELWERRDAVRSCITQAALDEMGGVAGALSRHADGVLSRLSRSSRQEAHRLLCLLITAEGTRGQRSEEELTAGSDEARATLRALIEGRLLHTRTTGDQVSHEIAHEALISSWGTLRQWLDEDAGLRALRQRLETAGAEWERLGRAPDLLWRKRQLEEARTLDTTSLGTREQDFLRASRRAVRRQKLRRWSAGLLLVLLMAGLYGGPRLRTHLETQRFVSARMAVARNAHDLGRKLGRSASARRDEALALFDATSTSERRLLAETKWAGALDELTRADAAFDEAEQALNELLERAHEDARPPLLRLTYERLLLAERFHRTDERARLEKRFRRLAAGNTAWLQRLEAPAGLAVETRPSGVDVELTRYVDDGGRLRREAVPGAPPGQTPLAWKGLPAGSYQLRFTREGHAPVELPVLLTRGRLEKLRLELPSRVPDGYVYIPPGCSLTGSAEPELVRKFMGSAPLHPRCLEQGYLIGRTEVTLGDWLAYLDGSLDEARQRRVLAEIRKDMGEAFTPRKRPDGSWSFSLQLESKEVLTAREGEPIRYPGRRHRREQDWRRFPLTGVNLADVEGYLQWLDHSGKLPGARLCSELEWTRAARGADDRKHPHGNHFQKDDDNIDETYDRQENAMGPDEVDAHPASVSPFGLLGMAGNVMEMTRAMTPDSQGPLLRGGAWYYSEVGTLIANRQAITPATRDSRVGVRVCAPVPHRSSTP